MFSFNDSDEGGCDDLLFRPVPAERGARVDPLTPDYGPGVPQSPYPCLSPAYRRNLSLLKRIQMEFYSQCEKYI